MALSALLTRLVNTSLDDSSNPIAAKHSSSTMKQQEPDPFTPPYSPLSDSGDVPHLSLTAVVQELEELPPPHSRDATDAQHLSAKRQEVLPFTPPYSPLSASQPLSMHMEFDSMSDSGALLAAQAQKLGHGLVESREGLAKMVELQQRLAKHQKHKLAKRNAKWASDYDALRREKEKEMEVQRALDEKLKASNAKTGRLHTELTEQEKALSAAIEDSERKTAEMDRLQSLLDDSRNAIEAHRQSLTTMREELDQLTKSRDELCDQNKGLEDRIGTQASEVDSLRGEIRGLADSLSTVERKSADDLADARRQMEKQALELAAVQEELDGSLNEAADLRQELGSLNDAYDEKCSELDEAVRQHNADARLRQQTIESLTKLSEGREAELAAAQKQLEGERQEILNLRRELGSLESEYDELCAELDEVVRQHEADAEASRAHLEAREAELVAMRKELDGERDVIVNIRQELGALKNDYDKKCSEFDDAATRHEAEVQSLEQKLGEMKAALDSETAGRRQLERELEDARNEIVEKEQIIKTSSLTLDEVQKVVTDLQNALEQQLELLEDDELSEDED